MTNWPVPIWLWNEHFHQTQLKVTRTTFQNVLRKPLVVLHVDAIPTIADAEPCAWEWKQHRSLKSALPCVVQ